MGVINRFRKNNQRTVDFFRALPQLYMMFKNQAKVEVIKISVLIFLSKLINMIVMFIPLKILFVLSGSKNISFFQDIENNIGRDVYIGAMITIITVLYFLNVVLQVYKGRLLRRKKSMIEKKKYEFRGMEKSHKVISKTYALFCKVLGDMILTLLVATTLFLLNVHYAIFYLSVILVYTVVIEQWAFPLHQANLMKKLKIDSRLFIQVTSIMIFLILFLGIIAVVLNTDMVIIVALLMFILVRLGNEALKSFFSCQIKLRQYYL
jgi:hypothetical protein